MNRVEAELIPITFVYLGSKLPTYAHSSILLAEKFSGLPITLLGNRSQKNSFDSERIKFVSVEDFYDATRFFEARNKLTSNHEFRSGFWLKSLERFFVLYQYAKFSEQSSILHAELDQLLFNLDKFVENIQEMNKSGVFLPFHKPDAAVASIFYCNQMETLASLLLEASEGSNYSNEMELLSRWSQKNSETVFSLPTLASELIAKGVGAPKEIFEIESNKLGGVVDAAQIGQWVGGIDPRNVPISQMPKSKFIDSPIPQILSEQEIRTLLFTFDSSDSRLEVDLPNGLRIQLFNLHMHSKIHRYLRKHDPDLSNLFVIANSPKPEIFPGTRLSQLTNFASILIRALRANPSRVLSEVSWRINARLGRRKSSLPFISGDTFRELSDFCWESGNKNFEINDISDGDIIFCESELAEELNNIVIERIEKRVLVILGNSDYNHSKTNKTSFNPEKVPKVFAQNLSDPISGFEVLPIGIENSWRSKNGKIKKRDTARVDIAKKKPRILWAFTIGTNVTERAQASHYLAQTKSADKLKLASPRKHQKALSEYGFVASPPGNGLDTHRTWEAMYFKCIPIVLRSYMTDYYAALGLPIWVVDSYEQLVDIDHDFLEMKYSELSPRFNCPSIWAKYWIELIHKTSFELKASKH